MSKIKPAASNSFVSFIVNRPWITLLAGLLIVGAFAAGLGRLKANFTHTAFFEKTDPALALFNEFERRFGNDDAVIVVVNSPSGIFDQDSAQLLRELTERMWQVPEVIRVDSLSNFQWVHAKGDDIQVEDLLPRDGELTPELLAERKQVALSHETLPGYLVGNEGKAALIYARIKPAIDAQPNSELIVAEAKKIIEPFRRGDHEIYLLGLPVVNDSFRESSAGDMGVLVPALLTTIGMLLLVGFRKAGGVILPFVVIIGTIVPALGAAGWFGVEMSSVTAVLPQVLVAVCVAESVHLLAAYYRARQGGMSNKEAAEYTLGKNLVPTFLTSVTTAAGFFSFVSAKLPPISGFGIVAGVGTCIAWLVTYLVVGPLLAVWPGKQPNKALEPGDDELTQASARSRRYVAFIDNQRWSILAVAAVFSIGGILFGMRNVVNSNPYEYFSPTVPVRVAQEFMIHQLSGITTFELMVDSGREDGAKDPEFLRKVEQLETLALEIPQVNRAVSLVDVLKQTNRALHDGENAYYKLPDTAQGVGQNFLMYTMGLPQGMDVNDRITVKNDALRVTLISTITDSNQAVATSNQLESIGRDLGLNVRSTGKYMLYQSMNGRVVMSFLQSFAYAALSIGLLILVSFRSLKLAALGSIPNIVPLCMGGAALYFISGTLDIGTVMVASVCLGIVVDNTIHIVTNYTKHVAEGSSGREALERLFAHAGPAMVITTVILLLGFSTLAFGTFQPNIYFGVLSAIVLFVGLIADFVLLPALLLIAERRAHKVGAPIEAASSIESTV
jgi:predicted RND superfamily exporter protein